MAVAGSPEKMSPLGNAFVDSVWSLENQFQGLSINTTSSTRSTPCLSQIPPQIPQKIRSEVALSIDEGKLLEFYQQQRAIGVMQKAPFLMKYDISVYRKADGQQGESPCFSSVDSPDWRKREISIRSTETIISLIDKMLRTPISQATKATVRQMSPQNTVFFSLTDHRQNNDSELKRAKGLTQETLLQKNFRAIFPVEAVPQTILVNPSLGSTIPPRDERKMFALDKTGMRFLIVPFQQLRAIGTQFVKVLEHDLYKSAGIALQEDIQRRIQNIFEYFFAPERFTILRTAELDLVDQFNHLGGLRSFSMDTVCNGLIDESVRQMLPTDSKCVQQDRMNPHLTDALVETFCKDKEMLSDPLTKKLIDSTKFHITHGVSFDDSRVPTTRTW